ncbi:hypothetical protein HDV00_001648 [Rhizophlyctis rosea]|nr:hypothetical protein HDV00_001648 [Rhizophlyctis rosea]
MSQQFAIADIPGVQVNTIDAWTQYIVPLSVFSGGSYDMLYIKFNQVTASEALEFLQATVNPNLKVAGFFGVQPDGMNRYPPLPSIPAVTINQAYNFTNYGQTYERPDKGTTAQFLCPSIPPSTAFPDLGDVSIVGYRETDVGIPVPLDWAPSVEIKNGGAQWQINAMFHFGLTVDSDYLPHPGLVRAMHNADYVEIGNATLVGKNNTLVVWMPELSGDQTHAIAAYAYYVKHMRDSNGQDTVAVHMRTRPPASKFGEDHILFYDYQLSYLRTGKDILMSLDDLELAYFKRTGFKASMEIQPILQKYTVYDGQNYGDFQLEEVGKIID